MSVILNRVFSQLFEAMKSNKNVTSLDLSQNSIGDEGAQVMYLHLVNASKAKARILYFIASFL